MLQLILFLLFSRQVMSDSAALWNTGSKAPRPSPSPGVCPDSCTLNRGCHPTISSSVTLFYFCPRSFPASGSFLLSQLFTSQTKYWRFSLETTNIGVAHTLIVRTEEARESAGERGRTGSFERGKEREVGNGSCLFRNLSISPILKCPVPFSSKFLA